MANEEHLSILKYGVTAWNHWRESHPGTQPDFRGASLREAKLNLANFNKANFQGADLCEASLLQANLEAADLSEAAFRVAHFGKANLQNANLNNSDLSWANLMETQLQDSTLICANLQSADLTGANLNNANLSEASLIATNFTRVDLKCTKFHRVLLERTVFADTDLSHIEGLESAYHYGPSEIGINTFFRSKDKAPELFLRRAGVPENFIEYKHSLTGTAIEYYSCFVSYSSKDQEFAERLYGDLQAQRVHCWFAPQDLRIGDKFRQSIDEAVRLHDKLLVVLSESSVNSTWVESEVETAFEKEFRDKDKLVLFPIRLDEAIMQTDKAWAGNIRRMRHIGDFTNWRNPTSYQKGFQRLLRDLSGEKAQAGKAP